MNQDAFSKCHPLTNFLFFLGAIGFSVVIQHPMYLLLSAVAAAGYLLMLKGRDGLRFLIGTVPLFVLVSVLNPLFSHYGEHVLFRVFGNPYTLEALCYGAVTGAMLAVMLLWFSCYSAVLTSDKFICLFGSLIPSLSMLLVMVLRMIPNLMGKAAQLSGARKSIGKGAGAQSTNREKLRDGTNILSALTDWALEGSIVTADSMRSRGYGTQKRTSFRIYRMRKQDWVLIVLMAVLVCAAVIPGGTEAEFTPEIRIAQPTFGLAAYFGFLMIPCVLQAKEAVQWRISISKI